MVIAAAHVLTADLISVKAALMDARQRLRLPDDYTFKHLGSAAKTREIFFGTIANLPLSFHAHIVDKRGWSPSYLKGSCGNDRICDGLITLVCAFPDEFVGDQLLLVDLPRDELSIVKSYRTAIRKALRGARRPTFADVRPRPDHRDESATVQMADMVAGEINQRNGVRGPYLELVRKHLEEV